MTHHSLEKLASCKSIGGVAIALPTIQTSVSWEGVRFLATATAHNSDAADGDTARVIACRSQHPTCHACPWCRMMPMKTWMPEMMTASQA